MVYHDMLMWCGCYLLVGVVKMVLGSGLGFTAFLSVGDATSHRQCLNFNRLVVDKYSLCDILILSIRIEETII